MYVHAPFDIYSQARNQNKDNPKMLTMHYYDIHTYTIANGIVKMASYNLFIIITYVHALYIRIIMWSTICYIYTYIATMGYCVFAAMILKCLYGVKYYP